MTWLGIDLGDARVGVALSDPELTFAHPIGDIESYGDSFNAIAQVIDLVEQESVEAVIVGLPLQLNGTAGKSAKKARRWAANLAKRITAAAEDGRSSIQKIPQIMLCDERLTTVSAHRQLSEAALASDRHRPVVDQQSAVLILQMALDRHRE